MFTCASFRRGTDWQGHAMSEWDVSVFGNDQAQDWLEKLLSGDSSSDIFRALVTVAKAPDSEFLQASDCEIALAAAELVAAARGKPLAALPDDVDEWLAHQKFVAGTEIVFIALRVVRRIGANSELKDLWADTSSSREWMATLQDLLKRLEDTGSDLGATVLEDRMETAAGDPEQLFAEAVALVSQGQHSDAINKYNHAIKCDPNFALAFLGRGTSYLELGECEKALKDASRTISLEPDLIEGQQLKAEAIFKLRRYDDAVDEFAKVIELDPKRVEAFWRRGVALERLGHYLHAIEDFTKVIEMSKRNGEAYLRRAEAYDKLGKSDLAAQDREKAKQFDCV